MFNMTELQSYPCLTRSF